ncbi:MAG: hypothetical protein ABIP89_10120 [Polyangiaceae bacterium]
MTDQTPTSRKKIIFLVLAALLIVPGLVFAAWAAITLSYSFSSGERAGYMQKISHRGWVCKTFEGELQMTNIPGAAPEKFIFSVRDPAVAKQLDTLSGEHVTLVYEEHRGVPTSCFGDTQYFVTGARKILP